MTDNKKYKKWFEEIKNGTIIKRGENNYTKVNCTNYIYIQLIIFYLRMYIFYKK